MEYIMSLDQKHSIKILKKYLKKEGCTDKQSKKLIQHSKRVLKTCKYMLKQLNIDDYSLIYKSAIFHDIAKMKYKKDHNKKAQMVLKSLFYTDEDLNKICEIIKYHKGRFNPPKNILICSSILRIADKIDKIYKYKFCQFYQHYRSNMKKIKKMTSKEDYKRIEKISNHIIYYKCLSSKKTCIPLLYHISLSPL